MEQKELKLVLQQLLKEVESENIVTMEELINLATDLIQARVLVLEQH